MKDTFTFYLPNELVAGMKRQAATQKRSLSDLAGDYLEAGLHRDLDDPGLSILLPELELMFKTELAKAVERMVRLQVRGTLESMTNRRILMNFMNRSGIDPKVVTAINEASYQSAVRSIKEPLEDLQEIINAADRSTRL